MQQVFWNLLSNAHKFTPIGGRIVVHTSNPSPGKVSVEVTDTGRGVEPDLLPKLFNAFEQGDPQTARRFGGLGLGLTISKAIVDAHHGTISAHSRGKRFGSTFQVELLTVPAGVADLPDASSPPLMQSSELAAHSLRILLVEDHEPTLKIISRLLRDMGHQVQSVGAGAQRPSGDRSRPFRPLNQRSWLTRWQRLRRDASCRRAFSSEGHRAQRLRNER